MESQVQLLKINSGDKNIRKDEIFLNNKTLNETEIAQKKIILKSRPRSLRITLTTKCNLRCIMCKAWQVPWDVPKKTLDEIVTFFPYLQHILWQGGEVFLSEYFEELFEKAVFYPNLKQDINTNGLLINEKWIKKLAKANVCLIYSIDGVTKDTYEYIRRGAKFEDLLRSVSLLKKHKEKYNSDEVKMKTIINVVVMKSNYRQLELFLDFAKEYKFDILQFTPVENISGSENIFSYENTNIIEYINEIMNKISMKSKSYGVVLFNCLPLSKGSAHKTENRNQIVRDCFAITKCPVIKTEELLCCWPWQNLFIDHHGKVRPECFCDEKNQ